MAPPRADPPRAGATIYGLRGSDHAGGVLMTLMSAAGATAVAARVRALADPDLRLEFEPGRLPICREIRAGGFARLVAALEIEVLDFPTWRDTKQALGETVYR